MKFELEFVEAKKPQFIDGVNFGEKLHADPKKSKSPILLHYNTDLGLVILTHKGKQHAVAWSSMSFKQDENGHLCTTKEQIVVKEHEIVKIEDAAAIVHQQNQFSVRSFSAQVEVPHQQAPKKPGRKPKFQGGNEPND